MPLSTSVFSDIKWCPRCGVDALSRDDYRIDKIHTKGLTVQALSDFHCFACGYAFHLEPSLRWKDATRYQKAMRQLRPT